MFLDLEFLLTPGKISTRSSTTESISQSDAEHSLASPSVPEAVKADFSLVQRHNTHFSHVKIPERRNTPRRRQPMANSLVHLGRDTHPATVIYF